MNTPVSFEIAKLLKEKRFPLKNTGYAYNINGELVDPCFIIWECEAPTIAEVVMWLYEKYGIWIEVYYDNSRKEFYTVLNGEEYIFNTPTEAYEAGIEYTLNNLM